MKELYPSRASFVYEESNPRVHCHILVFATVSTITKNNKSALLALLPFPKQTPYFYNENPIQNAYPKTKTKKKTFSPIRVWQSNWIALFHLDLLYKRLLGL